MALIHCDFFSNVLGLSSSICVILPEPKRDVDGKIIEEPPAKYATLYLLHGMSDDHTIWQRRTSIERYAAQYKLAVVMPAVGRSSYTDMANGLRYFTYVTEELPVIARSLFPLSDKREDNFVAGLSMGGYGALKIAMTYPERYAAAASLSGALDMVALTQNKNPAWRKEHRNIFGPVKSLPGGPNDLYALAAKLADSKWKDIPLYAWCGTEDFLYSNNTTFRDRMQELGLNFLYEEGPGEHEWGAWDQMIQRVLKWIMVSKELDTVVDEAKPVHEEREKDSKKGSSKRGKKGKNKKKK
jgi:putative tributyrin esterase